MTITTTVPWASLGLMYINMTLSYQLLPPILKFAPTPFAFRTFNLNFQEYDPQHPIYGPVDESLTHGDGVSLVSGFYKMTGRDGKEYAFVSVTNAILNTVVMSQDTWDLCISAPVPEPHNGSPLVRSRHVNITRNLNTGLTLDGTQPVVVSQINFDENTQLRTMNRREIEYSRPLHLIPNRYDPNVEIENSYIAGPLTNYKDSRGYRDYRISNVAVANKLLFVYEDIPLIIDGRNTNNTYLKERGNTTESFGVHCLQLVRRTMKYQQGYLTVIGPSETSFLNQQVTNNVLIPLGMGRTAADEDHDMPAISGVPAMRGGLGQQDEDMFNRNLPLFSNPDDNASLHPSQVLMLNKQQQRNRQFINMPSRGGNMSKQVTYADDLSWMPPPKRPRNY